MALTGGMRSDIRGYSRLQIRPQTTRMSLSDRFRLLQTRPVVQAASVIPSPARSLQMALQVAGQMDLPQRRIPVRQRLGPRLRPGVLVRNKHLSRIQSKAGIRKKKKLVRVPVSNFRRKPLQTRLSFKSANRFKSRAAAHNVQSGTFRPRLVRNNFSSGAVNASRQSGPSNSNRFKWRNPNLILNQTGQFTRRQPQASREQLDSDLDSYMSQSRGYLNTNFDRFLQ